MVMPLPERAPASALERLKARRPVFGIAQTIPSVSLTLAAREAGFDFVMLDCQQGEADLDTHAASIRRLKESPQALAAVRVKPNDLAAARQYAELGADAILAPDVRTREEAEAFVNALKDARQATLLFAMIESGLADVEAIAEVKGLDGLLIGPTDLSADLGRPLDFAAGVYRETFARVEGAAQKHHLLLGSKPHPGYSAEKLIEAGHTFIMVGGDIQALSSGMKAMLTEAAPHKFNDGAS